MKDKQSVEAQARSILQKVHNDACKKNHLPELGYSERAYDLVMELIAQAKQEALSTFKAQVRKEIEEHGYRKNEPGWEKISTEVKFYGMGYNDALDQALSIMKE